MIQGALFGPWHTAPPFSCFPTPNQTQSEKTLPRKSANHSGICLSFAREMTINITSTLHQTRKHKTATCCNQNARMQFHVYSWGNGRSSTMCVCFVSKRRKRGTIPKWSCTSVPFTSIILTKDMRWSSLFHKKNQITPPFFPTSKMN